MKLPPFTRQSTSAKRLPRWLETPSGRRFELYMLSDIGGSSSVFEVWIGAVRHILKIHHSHLPLNLQFQFLQNELALGQGVNHAHLIQVVEGGWGTLEGGQKTVYLITPKIPFGYNFDEIRTWQFVHGEELDFIYIFRQIFETLQVIHQRKYLLWDTNPGNFILGSDQWVTLIDFGGILNLDNPIIVSRPPAPFAAPEMRENKDPTLYGPWTDFYGVGQILDFLRNKLQSSLPPFLEDLKVELIHPDISRRPKSVDDILKRFPGF
jgi:serine/threonine protein kinase